MYVTINRTHVTVLLYIDVTINISISKCMILLIELMLVLLYIDFSINRTLYKITINTFYYI